MPPKPSITLTAAELRLMKLLWQHGESTVAHLVNALDDELAYTSVLTTIRVLESKGYVTHRQQGRAFLFIAAVAEQEASRSELRLARPESAAMEPAREGCGARGG